MGPQHHIPIAVTNGEAPDAPDTVLAEQQLDPGIADIVIMLRNLGFNPTDSGDGRSKPDDQRDFDVKHVACSVDEPKMFDEAKRLHQVLGWGWKVEASFDPSAGGSCILLATKNEPPSPRFAGELSLWEEADEYSARYPSATSTIGKLRDAGRCLRKALQYELGRR